MWILIGQHQTCPNFQVKPLFPAADKDQLKLSATHHSSGAV